MKGPEGFERSYWLVPDKILAGCYPGDLDPKIERNKLSALLDAGVTLVVNLMESTETDHQGRPFIDYAGTLRQFASERGREIRIERYPVVDMSIPSRALMKEILGRIRQELDSGGRVFVHCWGGKGRTGTVAGCWLAGEEGMKRWKVLEHLANLTRHQAAFFRPTPQTDEQIRFVLEWGNTHE